MLQLIFNTDFFFSILRITAPILFATLGNIVGGAVFVGVLYWLAYRKSK